MKTITLDNNDLFELRRLRERQQRIADSERHAADERARTANAFRTGAAKSTDEEREAIHALEVLDKILR